MQHIDKLINELNQQAQCVTESDTTDSGLGELIYDAAKELGRLKTALEDANGLCRSAMMIAERNGEANWPTFMDRLRESLERQHAVMYPPENDPSEQPADTNLNSK